MSNIVVIGAGHNGLVAATLLARGGHEVTVLEASEEPGGCVWTETLASGHRLERGAVEHGGITALADELSLSGFGLRYASRATIGGAAFRDRALSFAVSAETTAATLGADGPAYVELADLAARLFDLLDEFPTPPTLTELAAHLGGITGGDDLFRLLVSSCEVVLERRLHDPHLVSGLAMHGAHGQMPPWAPGTGMFALLLPSSHGATPARPIGGSRALVDALVAALEDAGGSLRTGGRVVRIDRSTTRPVLHLGDGDKLTADVVVSSIDLPRTCALFDDPPEDLVRAAGRVGSGRLNVAEVKIDVALDAEPDLGPLRDAPDGLWMVQDAPDTLRRAFGDVVAGRVPDQLPVMFTLPSASDPGAAPPGGAVAWISAFVPLHPEGGWTAGLEELATERALDTLRRVTGCDLAHGATVVTTGPRAWARRIGSTDGNPNHLDLSLDQLLGWRPSGTVTVSEQAPWLYLTGAGTHPGGGLTGAPGRATAEAILQGGGPRRQRRRSELASLWAGWQFYRSMRRGA